MKQEELIKILEGEGYKNVVFVKGKGLCGLHAFIFTIGLVAGLDQYGYDHRYCYPHAEAVRAVIALAKWSVSQQDVTGDPEDEFWIKRKGTTEYMNSKHVSFDKRFDSL